MTGAFSEMAGVGAGGVTGAAEFLPGDAPTSSSYQELADLLGAPLPGLVDRVYGEFFNGTTTAEALAALLMPSPDRLPGDPEPDPGMVEVGQRQAVVAVALAVRILLAHGGTLRQSTSTILEGGNNGQ